MCEPSPILSSKKPIAITTIKHCETSLPFLLWLFGTPLAVLFQIFHTAYK
jgi:hypothetical protein